MHTWALDNSVRTKFYCVILALLMHFCLFYLAKNWKLVEASNSASAPSNIKIKIYPSQGNAGAVSKTSAIKAQPLVVPADVVVSKTRKKLVVNDKFLLKHINAPIPEQITSVPEKRESQKNDPSTLSEAQSTDVWTSRLRHLLPNNYSSMVEKQQNIGEQYTENSDNNSDFKPEIVDVNAPKKNAPNVVTTEFNALAYRMELEKRFSQAWGGVRMLPSNDNFFGHTGELIVFNVIINRDGTLRRVVNVSALEQPGRNFDSVNRMVQDFANSVFPMNPIPDKIIDNPYIVRWVIRFLGYQYSFF